MSARSEPAFIEIVERIPGGRDPAEATGGYIKPNEVRINGVPLAVPRDETITIHEVDLNDGEVVRVTLTLFARRVVVGAESAAEASP